jgi:hypothetical protein
MHYSPNAFRATGYVAVWMTYIMANPMSSGLRRTMSRGVSTELEGVGGVARAAQSHASGERAGART